MSGSNCCFLTCIQIYQEADKVVWYSHLFKNFEEELWDTKHLWVPNCSAFKENIFLSKFLRWGQRDDKKWKKFSACEANNHEKQWIQKLEQMQGCVLNREYFLPPGQRYNTFIQQDFKITNVGFSFFCFLNGSVLFSWVVVSFSKLASVLSCFSRVQLFVTLWIVVHQAPLSMGFSRQEYWSGLLYTPPEDLSKPGTEPMSLISSELAGMFFTTNANCKALFKVY